MAIKVNLKPLAATAALLYLGHTMMYNNRDWAAHYRKLWKAQRVWGMVAKVLENGGVSQSKYNAV